MVYPPPDVAAFDSIAVVPIQLSVLEIFYATVIGLALANAYAMTQTIIPGIAIHCAINLSSQRIGQANPRFDSIAMVASVLVGGVSIVVFWRVPIIIGDRLIDSGHSGEIRWEHPPTASHYLDRSRQLNKGGISDLTKHFVAKSIRIRDADCETGFPWPWDTI